MESSIPASVAEGQDSSGSSAAVEESKLPENLRKPAKRWLGQKLFKFWPHFAGGPRPAKPLCKTFNF